MFPEKFMYGHYMLRLQRVCYEVAFNDTIISNKTASQWRPNEMSLI
jgi:hypothetical protein